MKLLSLLLLCCAVAASGSNKKPPKKIKWNREARLYNLQDGKILIARYRDTGKIGGPIELDLSLDETLRGEYSTVVQGDTTWGAIFSTVGSAAGGSSRIGNAQRGSAIMTSDRGTILQCEYVVNIGFGTGQGYCSDNHDGRYKVMFGKR